MQGKTVAVMQPYFMPYAGYYRLMAATDVFVIYDCVQFPKGGWVHRNRLPDARGELRWLTLPVERPSLGDSIESLRFMPDAAAVMQERLQPFPGIAARQDHPALSSLMDFTLRPVDYLSRQLETMAAYLGLPTRFVRASSLEPAPAASAAERVIGMVRGLGGTRYVNAPGGKALYDEGMFADAGLELLFLVDHPGPATSMLHRVLHEDKDVLHDEIMAATRYQPGHRP